MAILPYQMFVHMNLQKTTSIKSPVSLLSVVFNNHLSFFPRKTAKGGHHPQPTSLGWPNPLLRRPFLGSSLHLKKTVQMKENQGLWKALGKWDFFKPNHPAIWCVSICFGADIPIFTWIYLSQSRLVRKHATNIAVLPWECCYDEFNFSKLTPWIPCRTS